MKRVKKKNRCKPAPSKVLHHLWISNHFSTFCGKRIELWLIFFQSIEYFPVGLSNCVKASLHRLVCWLVFFWHEVKNFWFDHNQTVSKRTFIGRRNLFGESCISFFITAKFAERKQILLKFEKFWAARYYDGQRFLSERIKGLCPMGRGT